MRPVSIRSKTTKSLSHIDWFAALVLLWCHFSSWICGIRGHVALTFPPARKYDLDFLDSSRTKAPCGMPKGNIRTTLLEGRKFNVTWHLGYPHKGGFKIHLLDFLERPLLDLTPTTQGSEFVSDDTTSQHFQVQLPNNFTCDNCTLRLLRQALEWGANYKFWSCADIDIKSRNSFRETCSGSGRNLVGRCKCDKLHYGDVCQYKDECMVDNDCGDHGKCIDIDATTYPKKQCYCQLGWFGPRCNKRSPVRTTEIDLGLYEERKLSNTFRLFWRILKEHQEIEAVMLVNGTSYAALGWRPSTLTKSCKNFPKIEEFDSKSTTYLKTEQNSTSEPISAIEPTKETQSEKSEPEPESTSEAEPAPESTSKAEPEPEGQLKFDSEELSESITEPEPNTAESITEKDQYSKSLYSRRSTRDTSLKPSHLGNDVVKTSVSFQVSRKKESEPERGEELRTDSQPESSPEPETASQDSKSDEMSTSGKSTEPEPIELTKSEPATEPSSSVGINSKSIPNTTQTKQVMKPVEDNLDPYTPRHDFSPMDCTDIVIGSARGTYSRIGDYYTRDRSTPRPDNYWGGENDITAAMGFEKDGVTTILFRKKLASQEPTDHAIEDSLMHVIFAQGQEKGKYVHVPKSGIESESASIKDFYKPDELKYHGHKDQRGVVSLNFFEDSKREEHMDTPDLEESVPNTNCSGVWKVPRNCNPDNYTCEYSAQWKFIPREDSIRFVITNKYIDTWTGIGFSNDEKMSQTDAIIGWVDKTGRSFLMDTWITGYTQPFLDSSQNIFNTSGRIVDGVTTLSFSRKRNTHDPKDLSFTDDNCLFMMFPVRGGAFNSVNKKIRKHEVIPTVSVERICIKSCGNDETNDDDRTTEPPLLSYNVVVKLINLGENFQLPAKTSVNYNEFSNSIADNFMPIFQKIPKYRNTEIKDVKQDQRDLITTMNVQFSKPSTDKEQSSTESTKDLDELLHKILQESIGSGQVGNLKVDPQYLVFEPQSLTIETTSDTSKYKGNSFWKLPETRLFIVLGCLAALIIIAVTQGVCTIYRATSNTRNSYKDHLIPDSVWKEFSANTNYAFEALETKNTKNQVDDNKKVLEEPEIRSGQVKPNLRIQKPLTRPSSAPSQPPGNFVGDTRSLQRHRGVNPSANMERMTFSLPRNAYERSQMNSDPALQPDFYFMPSQRKFSGEVVRVFVDYNKQNK